MSARRSTKTPRTVYTLMRRAGFESLEPRTMLAADLVAMQEMLAMDVDGDLNLSPTDVIGIVNELNDHGTHDLHKLDPQHAETRRLHRLDTDRDGFVVANDVVRLVNKLNLDGPQRLHLGRFAGDAMVGLSATQQANLETLFADVNQLRMEFAVTPDVVVELVHDLSELANGLTPPSPESVQKLADDLAAAGQDGTLSEEEITTLTTDIRQVLQEANVSEEQVQNVVADLRAIVAASGITMDDVHRIASDLKNILVEFAANHEHHQQLNDVRHLLQNVAALRAGEHLSLDRLRELAQNFTNVVGKEHQPDPRSLSKLAADYLFANLDQQLSGEEIIRLRHDLYAVLTSGHIKPDFWNDILRQIHQVARLSPDDDMLQSIAHDLLAIGRL